MINGKQALHSLLVFLIAAVMVSISPASATIFTQEGSDISAAALYEMTNTTKSSSDISSIFYFYDPDCESCQAAEEFFESYLTDNPDTKIEKMNIFNETGEKEKFDEFKTKFNRETLYVPVVFIGTVALEGSTDIRDNFEDVYHWYHS